MLYLNAPFFDILSTKMLESVDSTELAFNTNLPNLIELNIAFYMHLIRQLDLVHVKCDV